MILTNKEIELLIEAIRDQMSFHKGYHNESHPEGKELLELIEKLGSQKCQDQEK